MGRDSEGIPTQHETGVLTTGPPYSVGTSVYPKVSGLSR
jgi:hypothetical protein